MRVRRVESKGCGWPRHVAVCLLWLAYSASGLTAFADPRVQVEGGNDEIRNEITQILSASSAGDPDALDEDAVRQELVALLAREGYWSARVIGPRRTDSGSEWSIALGPVWVVDSVRVSTRSGTPAGEGWSREATRVEETLSGLSPPDPVPIHEAAGRLLTYWEEHARPFARVVLTNPPLEEGRLDLALEVDPGPEVTVTDVVFEGEHRSRPSYLKRLLRLPGRDPLRYRESFWVDGARRLRASGHFTNVSPPRVDIVLVFPGDTLLATRIVYQLREGVSNQIEAAAGYSGQSQTLSGLVHVSLGNLWGTGRTFSLRWERRQARRTSFHLRYQEPYLWRLPVQWRVQIEHVLEDTFYTRTDLRGVVAWEIEENLWMDAGLRNERNVVSESLGGGRTRTSSLFGLRWEGLGKDPARESGFAAAVLWSRGQTRAAEGEGLRETVHEVEFRGEVRGALPLLGLGRLRALGAGRFLDEPIPLFETYGVGGAATLRGYREEEFRALRYGIVHLEAGPRLGPGGSRFLLFVDAGWLLCWEKEGSVVQGRRGPVTLRGSYGLGVRSLSRRGLVRIDYGVPWGGDPTSGRLHVALEAPF